MSGYFARTFSIAVLELRRDRRAGEAAVDDDLALAAELHRPSTRPSTAGMRFQSEVERVGAGLGHHLVEADDDDAGVAGLLDRRVERRRRAGVDEDGVGLGGMMLLSELICAWTVFSTFSMWRSTRPASGPLFTDDLGDALHLLAPVVADEVVGQVDRVLLVGGNRRRTCRDGYACG